MEVFSKIKLHKWYLQENDCTHTRGPDVKCLFVKPVWMGFTVITYSVTNNGLPISSQFCF
jgi:hypothetical protein